jgi:hypothetical protein
MNGDSADRGRLKIHRHVSVAGYPEATRKIGERLQDEDGLALACDAIESIL